MRSRNSFVLLVVLGALTVLIGTSGIARADDLLANWMFNEPTGSTSFADSSGNGNSGTLAGPDSVVSMNGGAYPASPVGTGVYFNGLSGTGNYVSVPYSSAMSGMMDLTLSAWVYIPTPGLTSSSPKEEVFGLFNQNGGNQCYQFGTGFLDSWLAFQDGGTGGPGFDTQFVSNQTPGHWMLLTAVYNGGSPSTAVSWMDIFENGVCVRAGELNLYGFVNGTIPIAAAKSGQPLELAGGDNEWNGGLSDLGIWSTDLTAAAPENQLGSSGGLTSGTIGGETAALYFTPTSGFTALSGYGVGAMDKLFTLYDGQLRTTTTVATGNGALTWQYVASGLPGTSGYAGQLGTGQYYVQLDADGGGVETVATPEPATLALLASGLVGLLAYAWRKRN